MTSIGIHQFWRQTESDVMSAGVVGYAEAAMNGYVVIGFGMLSHTLVLSFDCAVVTLSRTEF